MFPILAWCDQRDELRRRGVVVTCGQCTRYVRAIVAPGGTCQVVQRLVQPDVERVCTLFEERTT